MGWIRFRYRPGLEVSVVPLGQSLLAGSLGCIGATANDGNAVVFGVLFWQGPSLRTRTGND